MSSPLISRTLRTAGPVARGAVASYGADSYAWGRKAGQQAARLLEKGDSPGMQPEEVAVRKHVFNPQSAARFGIRVASDFEPVSVPWDKHEAPSRIGADPTDRVPEPYKLQEPRIPPLYARHGTNHCTIGLAQKPTRVESRP